MKVHTLSSTRTICRGLMTASCIALNACGGLNATSDGAPGGKVDAAVGAADGPAKTVCDPLAPFGPWVSLGGDLQNGLSNVVGRPSADELSFYFCAIAPGTDSNLYVSRRGSRSAMFGRPTLLELQNTTSWEGDPAISSNGLSLWFETNRANVYQVLVATRTSQLAEFSQPALAAGINSIGQNIHPFLADNGDLWFGSTRPPNLGLVDVWRARATSSGFLAPELIAALSSDQNDYVPTLSPDGLTVYVSSGRSGGLGGMDVWRSHRSTVNDEFPTPTAVTELNTAGDDAVLAVSSDNCRVYGASQGVAVMATRQP
jgi:hypothetical protein